MDRSFTKSILESAVVHIAVLLLLYFTYRSFMVVQTPLLMDLTLIGESSLGNGPGSPSAQSGQVPQQVLKTDNNPKMPAPEKEITNPAVDNSVRPEVAMKKAKKRSRKNNAPSQAALEKLNNSAPIGMEDQKQANTNIKTTEGVGHQGITGAPGGRVDIEGALAARTVLRQVDPIYPDWARKQGIEATVRFQLTVLPNGLLKESDIQLDQTCGYPELDRAVYDALIQWEFQPLASDAPQVDQSGTITFSFSLKNDSNP